MADVLAVEGIYQGSGHDKAVLHNCSNRPGMVDTEGWPEGPGLFDRGGMVRAFGCLSWKVGGPVDSNH
jgi:hypothetical protein